MLMSGVGGDELGGVLEAARRSGMGEDEAEEAEEKSLSPNVRSRSAEKYESSMVAPAVADDTAAGGSGAVTITGSGSPVSSLASRCKPLVAAVCLCCCLLRLTASRLNLSAVMYCSMSKHAYMMSSFFWWRSAS